MRALAITGTVTAPMISSILATSAIRATPPSLRMSAGTRSSAMTAHAPASSAILACSALVTSMMTPPFSISAKPDFTRKVPVSRSTVASCPRSRASVYRRTRGRQRRELPLRLDPDRAGEELHPGHARREGNLRAGLRDERGHVLQARALPPAHDHPAVPEHVRLARAGQLDLGEWLPAASTIGPVRTWTCMTTTFA